MDLNLLVPIIVMALLLVFVVMSAVRVVPRRAATTWSGSAAIERPCSLV